MFDAVKTLTLMNIQSHVNTKLYFNRTGVHRISAEGNSNSYGKSAILKGIDALFLGQYLNKEGREALIRYGCEFGVVSATSFSGLRLSLVLHLDSSKTFYMLEYNGEKIVKYLSDDYKSLLKVANLHYFEEAKFSLNRYKTKTTLPFTHTSGTLNYKILDSASELPKYKQLITMIDSKLEQIKYDKMVINNIVTSLTEQIKIMDTGNIEQLEYKLKTIKNLRDRYHELKPIVLTLKDIKRMKEEKDSIKLNDFSAYKIIKPQLDFIKEMILILNKIKETRNEINKLSKLSDFDYQKVEQDLKIINLITELSEKLNTIKKNKEQIEKYEVEKVRNVDKEIEALYNLSEMLDVLVSLQNSKTKLTELEPKLNLNEKYANEHLNIAKRINELMNYLVLIQNDKIELDRNKKQPVKNITKEVQFLIELSGTINTLRDLKSKKNSLTEQQDRLKELDIELGKLIDEIGVCTKCGRPLDRNHHHNFTFTNGGTA